MAAAQKPAEVPAEEAAAGQAPAGADATAAPAPAGGAEAQKPAEAKATAGKSGRTPKAPGLEVLGPVAVLRLKSGGERYAYRGAAVGDEYEPDSVKHAQSIGLVGKPKK